MKKRFFLGASVAFTALVLSVCASVFASTGFAKTKNVKANPYTFTVTSADFAQSDLTTSYQQLVVHEFAEEPGEENYTPVLNYFLAKKDADNKLVLAPNGKVYNYQGMATYGGRITDIISISVTYSGGTLYVQSNVGASNMAFSDKVALTSGATYSFENNPNYFMLSNSVAETTITSISVSYSCSAVTYSLGNLGEKYLGVDADYTEYVLTRDGENVSVAGQTGTIAVTDAGAFTITLNGGAIVYTGTVSADFKTLSFTGKTGPYAAVAPDLDELNRVYVVDDFEDYADRGTGYTDSQASAFTATNLRAAYYVDVGNGSGGNTWVSGSSFKIPDTGNYLNLATNVAHTGSQSMAFQGRKAAWTRLWSSEVFNQAQHYNFGSGNRLSFWAHGAFNNPDCTGNNSSNVSLRVQVYYKNFALTESSRNPGAGELSSGTKDFTIKSGSDWTEYYLNIDPTKQVYAVNFMINNSGLATDYVFVPIDDITIYTKPAYVPPAKVDETSTKITKTYHGTAVVGGTDFTVKVGLGANGYVYAWAGADMKPTKYTISGSTIIIETSGSYTHALAGELTFGTWTGTLSNNNKTITIVNNAQNITGTIQQYVNSSQVVLNEDTVLGDGSEGTAGLRTTFVKQYNNSGWKTDSESADRIVATPDYYIQGDSGIAVGKYGSYATRIITASNVTFESLSFWYFIPASGTLSLRLYVYKDAGQTGGYPTNLPLYKDWTDAGEGAGWHYVNVGIDEEYRGSFAIFMQTNQQAVVLDYITYF